MKTFKQYVNEAQEQLNRRGFLKGLASFAASAAVPAPVVKLLSTPAGVATMPVAAGIALLKGIQDHLSQWSAEDDSDYYEAYEDMADDLGFEEINPDDDDEDGYDISATDQMFDLLDLYRTNPKLAATQLIKHLQSVAIDSKDIETSFKSRANDPNDWRYQNKTASDVSDQAPDITNISRLAGLAKGVAGGGNQKPASTVKDMGPVRFAKDTPALPAPTKPEVDLTPDLKSKEKVPVRRNGDDEEHAMSEKLGDNRPTLGSKRDQGKSVRKWREQRNLAESTELSGILKNAGLKTND